MKNSDAYRAAVEEIANNKEIQAHTGGITGYGIMPSGSIRTTNEEGEAQLEIKVLGKDKDVSVSAYLEKRSTGKWEVIRMEM